MKTFPFNASLTILLSMIQISSYAADGDKSCEKVFSDIYKNRVWGTNEKGEGTSGPGSAEEHTKKYVVFLQKFMTERDIKSVVDAGCGDWEISRFINWDGIQYQGYDVVKSLIDKNQQKYAKANISFISLQKNRATIV